MKSILITGGSGFFGRHFARRCLDEGYERICIYSRNEFSQFKMREEFHGDDRLRWFIGDVRDRDRLRRAMEGVEHVVHAAALKRIEVGAYNPTEMVKTNVLGTMNATEAAMDSGVRRFVLLSSDKAWQPVSAYGHSKAMAESLVLAANNMVGQLGPTFFVTRYGNVVGSTGSVVPNWREAIKAGKPVNISDPDCTRFWMFASEACDLVLNALNHDTDQRLFIPRDLPAFRIGDLAMAMSLIAAEMPPMFRYTGIGEYEKMHEGMADGCTSDRARRMTVDEIREALKNV